MSNACRSRFGLAPRSIVQVWGWDSRLPSPPADSCMELPLAAASRCPKARAIHNGLQWSTQKRVLDRDAASQHHRLSQRLLMRGIHERRREPSKRRSRSVVRSGQTRPGPFRAMRCGREPPSFPSSPGAISVMKLVTFSKDGRRRVGIVEGDEVVVVNIPDMRSLFELGGQVSAAGDEAQDARALQARRREAARHRSSRRRSSTRPATTPSTRRKAIGRTGWQRSSPGSCSSRTPTRSSAPTRPSSIPST